MNMLSETEELIKQFKHFSLFPGLNGIIPGLEDKIDTEKKHFNQFISHKKTKT